MMNGENDNRNANNGDHNLLQIQDLEHYLQQNGLLLQGSDTLDNQELARRIKIAESYKNKKLNEYLKIDSLKSKLEQRNAIDEKNRVLNLCRGRKMVIMTNGNDGEKKKERLIVSMYHFVLHCDTIYAFVKSLDYWSNNTTRMNDSSNEQSTTPNSEVSFMLDQFEYRAILEFIKLVHLFDDEYYDRMNDVTNDTSSTTNNINHTKKSTNKLDDVISPENIIECCKIAHYLQSTTILEQHIIPIIQSSIDSQNCASICILADQLQLPSLMNTSMSFVMEKLDDIQSDEDLWNDFPSTLQYHIQTLYNAAQSSIISRGRLSSSSATKKVLFSSSDEFLSIFYDLLQENKERLKEAKQRQEEIINERIQYNQSRGRYAQEMDVYGGSVIDAAWKIEKQEQRVKTLETFYEEQKSIFSRDAKGDGVYKSSFSL